MALVVKFFTFRLAWCTSRLAGILSRANEKHFLRWRRRRRARTHKRAARVPLVLVAQNYNHLSRRMQMRALACIWRACSAHKRNPCALSTGATLSTLSRNACVRARDAYRPVGERALCSAASAARLAYRSRSATSGSSALAGRLEWKRKQVKVRRTSARCDGALLLRTHREHLSLQ